MKWVALGVVGVWSLAVAAPSLASACPDDDKKPSVLCPGDDDKKPSVTDGCPDDDKKPSVLIACPGDDKKPTVA